MLALACIPWAHDQGSSKRNMKVLKNSQNLESFNQDGKIILQ